MKRSNINYILNMTKEFLDGERDSISMWLDVPYEVMQRYAEMQREDECYADLIYEYLIEKGTNRYHKLTDEEFRNTIKENYQYVKRVAREGFW